ncbi:MAG: hypothetical protein U5R06_16925 [candidate division KSB1 bacterium]|nr:hypothetical protein [candidate division KSB1 bacterium]
MKKPYRNILINSTLAFISAFILTTVFHESGHYLAYVWFGADPTLFHNYVQANARNLATGAKIITSMGGPVFSLIQGMLFAFIVTRRKQNTVGHLLFLWLALLGFVNFFGYLAMTPLSSMGDTGKVAELLHLSFGIQWLIAAAGLLFLMGLVFTVGKNFANFIPGRVDEAMQTKYVYHLMFFPIIIGSAVNVVTSFPVVVMLSVVYPATSSFAIMVSFPAILKAPNRYETGSEIKSKIITSMLVLVLCAVALNRLLTLGF